MVITNKNLLSVTHKTLPFRSQCNNYVLVCWMSKNSILPVLLQISDRFFYIVIITSKLLTEKHKTCRRKAFRSKCNMFCQFANWAMKNHFPVDENTNRGRIINYELSAPFQLLSPMIIKYPAPKPLILHRIIFLCSHKNKMDKTRLPADFFIPLRAFSPFQTKW